MGASAGRSSPEMAEILALRALFGSCNGNQTGKCPCAGPAVGDKGGATSWRCLPVDMTLAEAATAVKMTKQGLLNAINKGRLSASKDANGQWRVDSAELMRVYPSAKPVTPTPSTVLTVGDAALTSELAVTKAKLEAAEAMVAELRRARDAWQAQAERLALTASPTATSTTAETAQIKPVETVLAESQGEGHKTDDKPGKRGFLARFFGWGGE